MRDIVIDLNNLNANLYHEAIIREGEHNASQLMFTLSPEFTGYTYKLSFKLNSESTYLTANVVPVNGIISYVITNALTHESGSLKVELQAYTSDVYLAKSAIVTLKIVDALTGIPIEMPSDYETYIQVVNHYMDKDIYDPNTIGKDAFSMDNMVETVTKKIFTTDERQKLALLSGGASSVEYVNFDTTPQSDPFVKGRMQWNDASGTITFGIGIQGVSFELNQAISLRAKNTSPSTLEIGQAVHILGSDGDTPTVGLADANGTENESYVVGITCVEPVLVGEMGYFITQGLLHRINTLSFNEGDQLWLSDVNGTITNIQPNLPSAPVFVGWCVKQASDGIIYVNINRYPIASKVPILDSGAYFNTSSVEGALDEIGTKMKTSYGEIYVFNGNSVQSIPTGTTYTKITPFMANGESLNCTPDAPNQQIIIARDGKYRITSTFSSKVDANATILDTALFKNGIEIQKAHINRISSINAPSSGSMTCVLSCVVGDILDVRVKHDKVASVGLTVQYGNLNVTKIVG